MTPVQNLYYALGEIVYAIAKSDGKVQREEEEKLHSILEEEFRKFPGDITTTEIIFQLLKRDQNRASVSFDWGLREIQTNAAFLSPELKEHFIRVVNKVAEAFPPVTAEERIYLERFAKLMQEVKPDSVLKDYTKPLD